MKEYTVSFLIDSRWSPAFNVKAASRRQAMKSLTAEQRAGGTVKVRLAD